MATVVITMKNPDAVDIALDEAVASELADLTSLSESEKDMISDSRRDAIKDACSKWIEYGEYLRVEIDTEAGTAVVLPVVVQR